MSNIEALRRRIDAMIARLGTIGNFTRLPVRILSSSLEVVYETPLDQVRFKHLPYKEYIDVPEKDGCEV